MYKYRLRPGYGSDKLLIEFVQGPESDSFIGDLMNAIEEINPVVESINDLWMNDEIIVIIKSDIGDFLLSKDIWDLAFIWSDENPSIVITIESLLSGNSLFVKEDVDFENYRKAGKDD